jgi:Bacteriophage lambda head decoration protein D
MNFPLTQVGDNPFAPGAWGYQYNPDQLIAGGLQLVTHNVVIMAGVLPRGTIIGRQTNYSITVGHGTNAGNGSVGSLSPGANVQVGNYSLLATSATVFSVTSPEGVAMPNATVGTAYANPQINFTITAGGTAFAAGDTFTLSNARSTGNCIICVKGASDGSQNPVAVLADSVDASVSPQLVGAYFMGEFNSRAVTIDPSWTLYDIAVPLQARGIHLKGPVVSADPVPPT